MQNFFDHGGIAATIALMGSVTAIRKQNEASEMSLVILVVLYVRTESFPLDPCENQKVARQKGETTVLVVSRTSRLVTQHQG
jgi:hypothetical protein